MRPSKNEAPSRCSGKGAGAVRTAYWLPSIRDSFAQGLPKRLPAFGRAIRANLLAGRRPKIGGGCVCIVTEWTIRTPLVQMVCEPSIAVELWTLNFLAGIDILLLTRAPHMAYSEALRDALLNVGSRLVSLHVVGEADYAH